MKHLLPYLQIISLIFLAFSVRSGPFDYSVSRYAEGYDLTVFTASLDQVLYSGGQATINYSIGNIGTNNFNSGVEVQVSLVSRINQSYIATLGSHLVTSPIGPGAFVNANLAFNLANSYVGDYYVKIRLDPNTLLTESNVTNNEYLLPVTIYEGDLFFRSTGFPDLISPNKSFEIGTRLGYEGFDTNFINGIVKYYLSTDAALDGADLFLGQRNNESNQELVYDFMAPGSATAGQTYFLIVQCDPDDLINEPDEDNNIVTYQVTAVAPYVDFEPVITNFPSAIKSGQQVQLDFDLRNNGNLDYNGPVNLRYYLSDNVNFDPIEDQLILEESNAGGLIAAGQKMSIVENLAIPNDWIADPTYVFVVVDEVNNIVESNKGNNTASATAQLIYANLQITDLFFGSGQTTDQEFTVEFSVWTGLIGPTAEQTIVAFYLSEDQNYGIEDTFLKSVSVPQVDLKKVLTTNVTISEVPLGAYYLFAVVDPDNLIPEDDENDNTAYDNLLINPPVKPDLVVSNVIAPDWGWPGQTMNVSFRLDNTGTMNTGQSTPEYELFISKDNILGIDDFSLKKDFTGQIGQNDFIDIATSVSIPSGLELGNCNLLIVVDKDNQIDEIYEQNNTFVHPISIEKGADASVLSGEVGQTNVNPGDNITPHIEVINDGTRTLVDLVLNFYLSQDRVLDEGDLFLQSENRNFINLAPGFTDNVSLTLNTPGGVSPAYLNYLILKLEPDDFNNANNIRSVPINAPELPDVEILSMNTFDPGISPGEMVSLNAELRNTGDGHFNPDIGFYLSSDSVFDIAADILLKSSAINLSQGETQTLFTTALVPNDINTGNYYLMIVVDPQDLDQEINETNNVLIRATQVRYRDFTINVSNAPGLAAPGQTLSVSATINTPDVNGVPYRYVISADELYDATDVVLGTFSQTVTVDVAFPHSLAGGEYFFIGIIDPDNQYEEFDESNNVVSSPITIDDQIASDLLLSNLSLNTSVRVAAQAITATLDIQNIGNIQYLGGVYLGLYVSQDNLFDAGDDLLYQTVISCPLPGGVLSENRTVTLPSDLAVGDYHILAVVDADNQVFELSENNNTLAQPLTIVYHDLNPFMSFAGTPQSPGNTLDLTVGADSPGNSVDFTAYPAIDYNLYLSQDTTLDASDILLSQGVLDTNTGTTREKNISVTIPVNYPAGSNFLLFGIDTQNTVPEEDESNNMKEEPLEILQVDQQIDLFTVRHDHIRPGGKYYIDYEVGASGSSVQPVRLLLSSDTVSSADDRVLYRSDVDITLSSPFVMPPDVLAGAYYLVLEADYLDMVGENNENNNSSAIPVIIEKPDIGFTSDIGNETAQKVYIHFNNYLNRDPFDKFAIGKCGRISYTIWNKTNLLFDASSTDGPSSVPYSNKAYFSLDTVLDPGDILLDEDNPVRDIDPVDAQGIDYTSQTFDFNVPNVSPGFYYIIIEADANNMYDEPDESNNTLALLVELRIIDFTLTYTPSDYYIGEPYNLTYIFDHNPYATCDVPLVRVNYFISSNSVLDGTEVLLGTFDMIPEGVVTNLPIAFPDLVPGDYYLLFQIDPDNAIVESNETNNLNVQPITVYELDFVTTIQSIPGSVGAGQLLNVTVEVGSLVPAVFPVKVIYNLAKNNQIRAANSLYSGELIVNAAGTGSIDILIPDEVYSGTYTLNIWADPDNDYVETDKKNNFDSKTIIIDGFVNYTDPPMNYVTSHTFDETGLPISSGRTYFDLSGRSRQTQTRDHETGQVHISQTLYDRYNRSVGTTMAAPSNQNEFAFRSDFVLKTNGQPYDHGAFDSDLSGPEPVGATQFSTLGWYFSALNTGEANVPVTGYPYSRIEYYEDGSGEVKRSGGLGEELRLGSGNTTLSGTFPVVNELEEYLTFRNTHVMPGATSTIPAYEVVLNLAKDAEGQYSMSIKDRNGNLLMAARKGTDRSFSSAGNKSTRFYLLEDQNMTFSGVTKLTNIVTGELQSTTVTIPEGFYDVQGNSVSYSYTNSFSDISYNYYDDAGRLITNITPNGVIQLRSGTPYSQIDKTTYTYNHQGWLLSTTETDAGTTNYKYRRDGSIRFSQNERQSIINTFSYTNYDRLGRPVESGEYDGSTPFGATLDSYLELSGSNGLPAGAVREWVKTYYDLADPNMQTETGLPAGYVQDFTAGAVSYTENEHIKTWYSYDEQGRVIWMAQKPKALSKTFLIHYSYDFLGNVLQTGFTSYEAGILMDEFYHYYTYDANKRLSVVYTSLLGDLDQSALSTHEEADLQARYYYYLHGPLKRIELGGNLQGIDFVYNTQGWLKQINHPDPSHDPGADGTNGFGEDAFGMILNYYESNMNNLFGITAADLMPRPDLFHGLPGTLESGPTLLADMFNMLQPDFQVQLYMKQFSAEQQKYREMLQRLRPKYTRKDG